MRNSNKLIRSFSCAFRGFWHLTRNERNFQIELFFAEVVIALMILFQVKTVEALVLILMIMFVLAAEITNTIVEKIIDVIKPGNHPYAKMVKDLSAASVLIAAVSSLAVGLIVFIPKILDVGMHLEGYQLWK